jgi:sterol desaturase/sphingolipid hydroxylase (fatty acid hydroxylase superfamily)
METGKRSNAHRVAGGVAVAAAFLLALELSFSAGVWVQGAMARVLNLQGAGLIVAQVVGAWVAFAATVLPFVVAEWWVVGAQSQRGAGKATAFWLVELAVAVLAGHGFFMLLRAFGLSAAPLVGLWPAQWAAPWGGFWVVPWGLLAALAMWVYLAAFDLLYYTFHRLQHRVPLLWKVHRTHHGIEHLSALNSYHHPLEDVLRLPMIALPLGLLLQHNLPAAVPVVTAWAAAWGYWIHSKLTLDIGPLRAVVGDNWTHHVHHGRDARYHDTNFASFFPLWDRVFGTYTAPPADALALPLGLDEAQPARNLGEYVLGLKPRQG